MKYLVNYFDEDKIEREHIFEAERIDVDLGNVIMEWVDNSFGVDSQTDGTDVWYENEDGEQIIVMEIINISEID